MSDRELLELAAKAAGYVIELDMNWGTGGMPFFRMSGNKWNPLADDGDALRLAVKLRIGFVASTEQQPEDAIVLYQIGDVPYRSVVHHKGDELNATRRAIVRAGAEIGKATP